MRCHIPWREHDLSDLPTSMQDREANANESEDRDNPFSLDQRHWSGNSSSLKRLSSSPVAHPASHHLRWLVRPHRAQRAAGPVRRSRRTSTSAAHRISPLTSGGSSSGFQEAARTAWAPVSGGNRDTYRIANQRSCYRADQHAQLDTELDAVLTSRLDSMARRHGLTPATLFQGAWLILLGGLINRQDLLCGVVSSGRHASVPGIDRMLGLLITTTPARAHLAPEETAIAFLKRLQREQAMLLPHAHLPLSEIQRVAGGQHLFDTLFTYENYPVDQPGKTDSDASLSRKTPGVTPVRGHSRTHYPLTLMVLPGVRVGLRLLYQPDTVDADWVACTMERLIRLLDCIANDPSKPAATSRNTDARRAPSVSCELEPAPLFINNNHHLLFASGCPCARIESPWSTKVACSPIARSRRARTSWRRLLYGLGCGAGPEDRIIMLKTDSLNSFPRFSRY